MKDLISPEGLRLDGRKRHEIRQLNSQFGTISDADGSAFFQLGNTRVVALVFGPHEPADRSVQSRINFDLSIASFAMPYLKATKGAAKSTRRLGGHNRQIERKSGEVCTFLQSTFDLLLGETFGSLGRGTQIDVMIEVLQSDGSLLAACFNAASAALVDAGIPMRDFVCACSVGHCPQSSTLVLDPNGEEEGQFRIPSFTCAVLPRTQEIVSYSLTAGRFPFDKLHEALKLAIHGATQIHKQLDQTLMNRLQQLVIKRSFATKTSSG